MTAHIKDVVAWAHTKYSVDEKTGCWIWNGAKYKNGYGSSRFPGGGRRNMVAHRAIYIAIKGEIAENMVLDHLCNNRACVNPGHLEPVTQRENLRRAGVIDRLLNRIKEQSEKEFCIRGHRLTEDNIYRYPNYQKRRSCRACMKLHGMSRRKGAVKYAEVVKELLPDTDLTPWQGESQTVYTVKVEA